MSGNGLTSKGESLRRPWSDIELAILRTRYPHVKASIVAAEIGRPVAAIYNMANKLGLYKTSAFFLGTDSGRADGMRGEHCRFEKGHRPWNKGKKGSCAPGCKATQFKPGQKPYTWKPIGSERVSKDGYLQRKITDTGYSPRDWIGVHILVWEAAHGPVLPGYAVCFRDGDKTHVSLENLECISRAELMRRNTIHNLPDELKEVIWLKAALTRKIHDND